MRNICSYLDRYIWLGQDQGHIHDFIKKPSTRQVNDRAHLEQFAHQNQWPKSVVQANRSSNTPRIKTVVGGYEFALTAYDTDQSERGFDQRWELRVQGEALPRDIELIREYFASNLDKALGKNDHSIGDPIFDKPAYASSDKVRLTALMNEKTRELVVDFFRTGGTLEQGVLRMTEKTNERPSLHDLQERLRQILALADQLSRDEPVPALLLDNTLNDPLPTVQAQNLAVLYLNYADSSELRQALDSLLDPHTTRQSVGTATRPSRHSAGRPER